MEGTVCVATDGETEAARSCSSMLTDTLAGGAGDDLGNAGKVDLTGAWNGNVDGSVACWMGYGRVASLKRRSLQTQATVSGMHRRYYRNDNICNCRIIVNKG